MQIKLTSSDAFVYRELFFFVAYIKAIKPKLNGRKVKEFAFAFEYLNCNINRNSDFDGHKIVEKSLET